MYECLTERENVDWIYIGLFIHWIVTLSNA